MYSFLDVFINFHRLIAKISAQDIKIAVIPCLGTLSTLVSYDSISQGRDYCDFICMPWLGLHPYQIISLIYPAVSTTWTLSRITTTIFAILHHDVVKESSTYGDRCVQNSFLHSSPDRRIIISSFLVVSTDGDCLGLWKMKLRWRADLEIFKRSLLRYRCHALDECFLIHPHWSLKSPGRTYPLSSGFGYAIPTRTDPDK